MRNLLIICAIAVGFIACEKDAGEGGTSLIEGDVIYFVRSWNSTTLTTDTLYYPKAGKDVYIIYSDDEGAVYDDKFETDFNGKYHFEFLRKGDYTVMTYVDSFIYNDLGGPIATYDYPIFKHIKITDNNSVNTVSDFVIEKNQ